MPFHFGKASYTTAMFNISNAVTIFTLLCILMMFIGRFKAKGAVAGSIWVKHSNISSEGSVTNEIS